MNGSDVVMQVSSTRILMEVMLYLVVSLLLITLIDWYVAKKVGGKRMWGYRILRPHKTLSILIVAFFTLIIGILCLFKDLTISRFTLTYFGLPYYLAVLYYLIKAFRRIRAETKGRQL